MGEIRISEVQALLLMVTMSMVPLLFALTVWVRRRGRVQLRPLPGYEVLRGLAAQAVESGKSLHVSLGRGMVGSGDTAQTLAALSVLDSLVEQGVACDAPPIITVGEATLLLAAQDRVRGAYARMEHPEGYAPTQVRLVAPEPTAYAAGVMDILAHDDVLANVMVGSFGDEYLLMGEVGAQQEIRQVVGVTDSHVLPFAYATADHLLIGEEMFAGGAYLAGRPEHIASLRLQDWLRIGIVLVVVLGVLYQTFL